jgi:hypothetical protein
MGFRPGLSTRQPDLRTAVAIALIDRWRGSEIKSIHLLESFDKIRLRVAD